MRVLAAYDWPGNVRELRNALWRAAILAEGAPIGAEHLGLSAPRDRAAAMVPVAQSLEDAERAVIQAALASTAGNKTQAAVVLGIARSTLTEKARRYGL
jgi:two-component system response regulator HydG